MQKITTQWEIPWMSPPPAEEVQTLSRSDKILIVSDRAALKALVLQAHTGLEWSGYGPITRTEGGWRLHDFYYLSCADSHGSTELTPDATAQAWQQIVEDGYDTSGVRLAWVHCHPDGMGPFWSGVDETAIKEQVRASGSQISVLFSSYKTVARYDKDSKGWSLRVQTEWGQFTKDICRATEVEEEYRKKRVVPVSAATVRRPGVHCVKCGGAAVLACDVCGERYCVAHLAEISADGILCGECLTMLNCTKCAHSKALCAFCDEPVCPDHAHPVAGVVLCNLCWGAMYGDD